MLKKEPCSLIFRNVKATFLYVDEKAIDEIDTLEGPQEMITINEPSLCALVIRANKPANKASNKRKTVLFFISFPPPVFIIKNYFAVLLF